MDRSPGTFFVLTLPLLLTFFSPVAYAQTAPPPSAAPSATWSLPKVQHAYGLPNIRANEQGTLSLDLDALTFTGKSGNTSVPRLSITAVNAGNERVELWGMKGRILRGMIPDGGGLAAAGFMHHKVGMLTVEFVDHDNGYHSAVFFLPADDAEHALASFSQMPMVPRELTGRGCPGAPIAPGSILVATPAWDQAEVPAAYRALVYERLISRLQAVKGIGHVYRDGEAGGRQGCPQYILRLSITGFRQGSQVKRAVMGPIGMFVGTTQMTFDATITDASGAVKATEQIKATVRGESENTNIADSVAKKLAKRYSAIHPQHADIRRAGPQTINTQTRDMGRQAEEVAENAGH